MKMSKYCFLCLSDEGVFLNITPYNYKSLCGEVESYLPVKIEVTRGKQKKVCYKCAYELKQCSDFVRRYKESHTNVEQKHFRKQCCSLCLEPAKKGYIFKLSKDNHLLNNLSSTIEKLLDENFPQVHKSPLICLTCRYILDILLDLTCLCQEMSKIKDKLNKDIDIDYSLIPKVNTAVIKRKTTATSFLRLKTYVINDSDSDSSINKNQSTAEMNKDSRLKLRSCDQCKNSIKHGEDMYRYHRSGLTVCKTCRGSMDVNRHSKRKSKQNTTDTKLCTVFLKDVLTNTTLKQQKTYKIEKDSYGNQVYVITESESEVELEDKVKVSKESEKKEEKNQTRSMSRTKSDSSDNETKRKKKIKLDKQSTFDLSKLRELPLRASTKRTRARCNHYSDTDILLKEVSKCSETKNKRGIKRRNTSISSVSDIDTERKSNRKKLRSILEHFTPSKDSDISDDTSTIEDSTKERNTNENKNKRKTRSSSASSTNESECSSKIKHLKHTELSKTSTKISKSSKNVSLPDGTDVDKTNVDANEKYICSKCLAIHENKLIAATHELTHFKQLELKLHKINISDKFEDEQQVDESSEKHLIDEAEQQNEEITLTVNDDEDIETAGITEDGNKQPDKEICLSATVNQEEDSLNVHIDNKESVEKTEVTDAVTEPAHEESTKVSDQEVKISETTVQCLLIPSLNDIKNDQIQNDSFKSEEVENEQKKIDKVTVDKDKMSEIVNVENTVMERVELNLKVIDEDERKKNEGVDDTENESMQLQESNTEIIENDITNETEKDKIKGNNSKIEEREKDKIEIIEIITEGQKEKNSDENIPENLEDFSIGDAKLNDTINMEEVQSHNLSQEKQKVIEENDNDNSRKKTNINDINNVTLEDSIENSVSACKDKSTVDNCNSSEGETEQVNEINTSHAEKESKCTSDTKRLYSSLENINLSESITKDEEVCAKEKDDKEATKKSTEMIENMFELATDELGNQQNVTEQNKRYSEMEAETLEDISREIQKSADMPSLEPISSVEVDHK